VCTLTVSAYEKWQNIKKQTAYNEGFGVRRGAVSWDTSQDFGSSAPVRAFAKPRPTPSPRHVVGNVTECVRLLYLTDKHRQTDKAVQNNKVKI